MFHLEDKINLLEDMFEKRDLTTRNERRWGTSQEGIVLQGACIIFTSNFINKEENAFLPITFMYGEEDLLANMCMKKGYKSIYSPDLKVLHLNGETTRKTYNSIDKNIFTYKYIIEGWKLLLKEMK